MRRHLHLMGLTDSPLCRKCGAEEETCAHILCRCETLASDRHAYLCSFCLETEDMKRQNLGAIWRFSKTAGLLWRTNGVQRACFFSGLGASGLKHPEHFYNQSINQSINVFTAEKNFWYEHQIPLSALTVTYECTVAPIIFWRKIAMLNLFRTHTVCSKVKILDDFIDL
jgi:hypothetical protein